MNVYLIGYRCSGKSVVGRALAEVLGRRFLDADRLLVDAAGRPIDEIVSAEGWDGFRLREKEILAGLCREEHIVVATGGGAVLFEDNVRAMKRTGRLIWLKASPETIRARMAADDATAAFRPALTGKGVLEEIAGTLHNRKPHYDRATDFAVATDDRSVREIVEEILDTLEGVELDPAPPEKGD